MKESLKGCDYEIILIDDQSIDGCCHGLDKDVRIVRTDTRLGVSGSRRLGVSLAKGDCLLFSDPHCDYSEGALRQLCEGAMERCAICLPRTSTHPKVSRHRFGGFLTVSDRGLKVSYALNRPMPWPALLGSIYAVRRDIYDFLGGWPQLPGTWGYSEQAMTLAAWFAGVAIYVDSRHKCNHEHYHPVVDGHDRFSYSVKLVDQANNGHWVHALFFPKTYEYYWAPILKKRFRDREEYWSSLHRRERGSRSKMLDVARAEVARRSVRTEEDFFRLVLGAEFPKPQAPPLDAAFLQQQAKKSKPQHYPVTRRQHRAVEWLLKTVPGCLRDRRVLDLGCRDGYTTTIYTSLGAQVEGVELVPETAKWAKLQGRPVIQGDMRHLPYKDRSWHLVSCLHALEHLPDPDVAIKEMLRVLIPWGWLFIAVPVEAEPVKKDAHNFAWRSEEAFVQWMAQFGLAPIHSATVPIKDGKAEIYYAGRKGGR